MVDIARHRSYGMLAAVLAGVYVAIVIGVGTVVGSRGNSSLTIVAAVVIAIAFQPLRQLARRFANRIVHGKRASPYEALSHFSERMADELRHSAAGPEQAGLAPPVPLDATGQLPP